MSVEGVIAVLTHKNRPPMAGTDRAYMDDVAPGGSPFRPLYDDKIKFSGQPIALVLAEDIETAKFAASLVRVEYEEQAHVTDLQQRLDEAKPTDTPPKPRGKADKALAAAAGQSPRRIFHSGRASQSDGAVRLHRDLGRRRQAHGLRQDPGRAERAALSLQLSSR